MSTKQNRKMMDWEKIAKRFARSIVRFQNDPFTANLPESTISLAQKISNWRIVR